MRPATGDPSRFRTAQDAIWLAPVPDTALLGAFCGGARCPLTMETT